MMLSPAEQGPDCGRYEVHQYARRYAQNPQCAGCGGCVVAPVKAYAKVVPCGGASDGPEGVAVARPAGPAGSARARHVCLTQRWLPELPGRLALRTKGGHVQGLSWCRACLRRAPCTRSREVARREVLTLKARCPALRCRRWRRCGPAGKNACAGLSSRCRRPRAARWRSPQSSSRPRSPVSATAGWC